VSTPLRKISNPAAHAYRRYVTQFSALVLATLGFALLGVGTASAKEVVAYFGTESNAGSLGGQFTNPLDIAVNSTGAGPAEKGNIYVSDGPLSGYPATARIQRFAQDDNGTPADPYDDKYEFISAWGADVDATPSGGSDYEICTEAPDCKAGVPSAGNGTAGGNGSLGRPRGIAVDQDSGNVYVVDGEHFRINVYSGDGTFLRAFGWDVVQSGPDDAGNGYEVCVASNGDVCKSGVAGFGVGQIGDAEGIAVSPPDGNPDTGTVFLADPGNHRIDTFSPDGSSPSLFGSVANFEPQTPRTVAVDSRGIVYASAAEGRIERYDSENANGGGTGFLAPILQPVDEVQRINIGATAGKFKLSFGGDTTPDLPFNASAGEVQAALRALPSIGSPNVNVSGGPGGGFSPYAVTFGGALAATDVEQITVSDGTTPLSGGAVINVDRDPEGSSGPQGGNETEDVTVGARTGQFRLEAHVTGGASFEQTPDLPYNASAAQLQTALESLPQIGPGNVSVSGGPGDFSGSVPYSVTFIGALGHRPIAGRLFPISGAIPLGGGGAAVRTTSAGHPGSFSRGGGTTGLEVDPDSDGAGPDGDVLYVLRSSSQASSVVDQFGPANPPGLAIAPASDDAEHGSLIGFNSTAASSLGLDYSNGRLFIGSFGSVGGELPKSGVYVLDVAGGSPTASLDSLSDITSSTVTAHATINPNGPPPVSYRLEYSTDGSNWSKATETVVGTQDTPQPIEAVLNLPPEGLEPDTFYHLRLAVTKAFTPPVVTSEMTFTTLPAPPVAETVGAPVRTATTAQLGGRVNPRNASTTYHFEYGSEGPCDANPCAVTADQPAGSGALVELVSEDVEGLLPSTTYHYRLVADNGNPGASSFGEDMTVRTSASDGALTHGHFPGPPGSDRAWEQVSLPDSGGNPVEGAPTISDDGSRAVYGSLGGTPISATGAFNQYFTERTPTGWQTRNIYPARDQLLGANWLDIYGRSDLSTFVTQNFSLLTGEKAAFRMSSGAPPVKLNHASKLEAQGHTFFAVSDDASVVLLLLAGSLDPEHPAPPGIVNMYDVGSGGLHLVGLLPDGSVPACGIPGGSPGNVTPFSLPSITGREPGWASPDGKYVFFPSEGNKCGTPGVGAGDLYVRDLDAAETKPIGLSPISGPSCPSGLIASTPTAAFVWTAARLVASDTVPATCSGALADGGHDGDVYRYDLDDGGLDCVTCVALGLDADVYLYPGHTASEDIAVSEDGSRVYFKSNGRLLPGVAAGGTYRVDVATGDLAYVGQVDASIGDGLGVNALTPDGSVFAFTAKSAALNPLGGSDNNGTQQYYRYDDRDRSLTCVSCPPDGSPPRSAIPNPTFGETGPNETPLSADGKTFVFDTPTPLVSTDQNTAGPGRNPVVGQDSYEWRDGRLLLISDGLTNWVPGTGSGGTAPEVKAVTPSGGDVLFTAAAQYTPDALDGYKRLYDARIGGGIEFPQPPPPCPLEVCQGTPQGAPEAAQPGTSILSGSGNRAPSRSTRCPTGRRKVRSAGKTRCVKPHRHKRNRANNRANHNGRATR
jgi:hypothetical protein